MGALMTSFLLSTVLGLNPQAPKKRLSLIWPIKVSKVTKNNNLVYILNLKYSHNI